MVPVNIHAAVCNDAVRSMAKREQPMIGVRTETLVVLPDTISSKGCLRLRDGFPRVVAACRRDCCIGLALVNKEY
jgi:hypothetical protein